MSSYTIRWSLKDNHGQKCPLAPTGALIAKTLGGNKMSVSPIRYVDSDYYYDVLTPSHEYGKVTAYVQLEQAAELFIIDAEGYESRVSLEEYWRGEGLQISNKKLMRILKKARRRVPHGLIYVERPVIKMSKDEQMDYWSIDPNDPEAELDLELMMSVLKD